MAVYDRYGLAGEITKEEIGIYAVHSGDIIRDYSLMLIGDKKCLKVIHMSHTREIFIGTVLKSLIFLMNAYGKISDMVDVLGLNNIY